MQMLNRAIEDAAAFDAFRRAITTPMPKQAAPAVIAHAPKPPKRPGENRQQYRARLRGMEVSK